jgi:replicative DNA helicase
MSLQSVAQKPRLGGGRDFPRTGTDLLAGIAAGRAPAYYGPVPTGFVEMDRAFGGGLFPEDLAILLGRQSVGKTIVIVQIMRHVALWARDSGSKVLPIVMSYEHSDVSLWIRLLITETYIQTGEYLPYSTVALALSNARRAVNPVAPRTVTEEILRRLPGAGRKAGAFIAGYSDFFSIYSASRLYTTLDDLELIAHTFLEEGILPFFIIDYLQVMPPPVKILAGAKLAELGTLAAMYNVGGLKDLAKHCGLPVLAVSAVDNGALAAQGDVHFTDALGPEIVKYAADLGIAINRVEDPGDDGNCEIIFSIEKNRDRGPAGTLHRHRSPGGAFYIEPQAIDVIRA